jgi:uncharacterized protein
MITGLALAHPDFDDAPQGSGLYCTDAGALATVSDAERLRQSLLMLLSTRPGERVMRPDYGCDLLSLSFAPNNDTTAGLAIQDVRQAVERFEPRVRILRLEATRSVHSAAVLEIVLEYQPRIGVASDVVRVGLPLDGSEPDHTPTITQES